MSSSAEGQNKELVTENKVEGELNVALKCVSCRQLGFDLGCCLTFHLQLRMKGQTSSLHNKTDKMNKFK